MKSFVQLSSSTLIAILSLIISSLVSHDLDFAARSDYGIYMVTLGQLFVFAQLGMPGAFSISGLYALKSRKWKRIAYEFQKRAIIFIFLTLAALRFFDLSIKSTILILIGYLICIPLQWIMSGFQLHVSNSEFAFWRASPYFLQCAILVSLKLTGVFLHLNVLIAVWGFSNLFLLLISIKRYILIDISSFDVESNMLIHQVSNLGKSGFIAHIGLADLIKIENYLIPRLKSITFSAHFFAVGGLANWPRVLVEGLSTSYILEYKSMQLNEALKIARYRILKIVSLCLVFTAVITPFGSRLLGFFLGNRYRNAFDLFIFLTLSTLFSGCRRLFLDVYRSQGSEMSIMASKLEFKAWLFSLSSTVFLFSTFSISAWAKFSAAANFIILIILLLRKRDIRRMDRN